MQPIGFNACVTAAVSDVFEDATMAQCAAVAEALNKYMREAAKYVQEKGLPTPD